jgi:predicted ATPase
MLTQITLKNFKCFKNETKFPLGKINLLTGVNGRGKSSMLQAMLLFRQSIEHNVNSTLLVLNGSCIELGTFDEVRNSENPKDMPIFMGFTAKTSNKDEVEFSLGVTIVGLLQNPRMLIPVSLNIQSKTPFKADEGRTEKTDFLNSYTFKFTYLDSDAAYWLYQDNKGKGTRAMHFFPFSFLHYKNAEQKEVNQCITEMFKVNRIHYIAADRIAPRNSYEYKNIEAFTNTGAKGEYTATILSFIPNHKIKEELCLGDNAQTLTTQTEEWLNYIFDGAKVTIETLGDNINITYNTNAKSHRYRATNVGFGYSYILPIIVSGLIASDGEILIVENPEAHLHPKAQNRLTEFLARVAACEVQVFVESHSEHILNGLRIAALRNDIDIKHDEISVLYFQDEDTEDAPFVHLPIEANGKIKNWPNHFFDQQEQDLAEIFKLGRDKK